MNTRFLALELRRAVRNGRYLIFTVVVPSVMFVLFVNLYGGGEGTFPNGLPVTTSLMMNMALFGVMAGPLSIGARIAVERGLGWQRQLRLTPLTGSGYLMTKGALGMLVGLPAILLVCAIGVAEGVRMDALHWVGVLATLWLGAVPFVLLGIVIGLVATADGMQAITGLASMLFGLLGGIWIPADVAPDWLATIMKVLPTYWVKQLTEAPFVSGIDIRQALVVIGLWVAGLSLIAVRRYRAQS
ncbi:ABC transporter permease [Lentzea nigeriaca]|uniref:ABC transporter permease n=1 Tax=Lentzea nigeriaca TaxID=1128665 RepID=UPI00195846AC|nr:ABC transporter permease [Lentzea nigeriaca]MBM7865051.1 ABC-2 type transport system permease protein [Lentzea nigeriaca]